MFGKKEIMTKNSPSQFKSWFRVLITSVLASLLGFCFALIDTPWFGGQGGGPLYCVGILLFCVALLSVGISIVIISVIYLSSKKGKNKPSNRMHGTGEELAGP